MFDPNFEFLNKEYPKIYKSCEMIDKSFAICQNDFKYPVALSRMTLEEILKFLLNKNYGELHELIDEYGEANDIDDDLFGKLDNIRKKGNRAVHNNSFKRKQAVDVVRDFHNVARDLLCPFENIKRYVPIEGNEEWINPNIFNRSDELFELYDKLIESNNKVHLLNVKINNFENNFKELSNKVEGVSNLSIDLENLKKEIKLANDDDDIDDLKTKINDIQDTLNNFNSSEIHNQIFELHSLIGDFGEIKSIKDDMEVISKIKDNLDNIDDLDIHLDDIKSLSDKYTQIDYLNGKLNELEQAIRNSDDLNQIKEKINNLVSYDSLDEIKNSFEEIVELSNQRAYNSISERMDELKYSLNVLTAFSDKIPDETQLKAIRSKANKLIINAGPGSGKTFVLIERVKFLINERGVEPNSLLVITYTEKAADELKNRLIYESGLSTDIIDQMQISTIHSACMLLLKDYYTSGLEIIDDNDNERRKLFIKKYKHRLDLDTYGYIPDNELSDISAKFDEYASFNIDTVKLEKNLRKKKFDKKSYAEKDQQYRNFIDKCIEKQGEEFEFPLNEVRKDKNYLKRWNYNKNLAVIQAFKKYENLLDEIKSYDFNFLLRKTYERISGSKDYNTDELAVQDNQVIFDVNAIKSNRDQIRFKNILVDEFQDTDEIQMKIFDVLIEGSETVTFVGDPDQSIFGFKGSDNKYFLKYLEDNSFEKVDLLVNYRTPQNIVDFNENFIKTHGRKIEKGNIISNKSYKGNLCYIENKSNIEEATTIVNIVKEMKKLGKINKFSDVALLFRYKYQMGYFIEELKKQDIDFHVQGISDFKEYPEVNSIMFLLWYLTKDMNNSNETHKKIFDLKDFGNENLDLEMFNLDEKTLSLLSKIENPVEFSYYNSDELKKLGLENEHDIEFFSKLNDLKYRIHNSVDNAKLDVLKIYYELFDVTGYLEQKFSQVSYEDVDGNSEILNLGFLSRKIHNFMETYDRYDLDTLFEMIYDFYEDYSSPKNLFNDDDCVQLLTIHKSKGLEFPVVFLCGLKEGSVPKLKRKTTKGIYDVDDKFKYHDIVKSLEEDEMYSKTTLNKILNKKYLDEEYRNIYVALTRAASILVVSQVINLNQSSPIIKWMLNSGAEFLELDETNVDELMEVESIKKDLEDELNLSFTSIEDYDMCPHKYNLIYNYDFMNPQNVYMRIGTIIHSILNKINTLAINGDEDLDDEVERIIDESKESNSDLLDNNIFINLLDQLDEYTAESEEWEILESEYPFTIKKPNYTLKGQIDLIRKIDNGISLLDFKTTSADSMDIDNNRYEDQLHFYHMAIKGNDKYKHHEEIMLELFSVSDMDESFEVPFSQEHIYELEGKLNRIHNEISNKQYWKCDDDSECAKCLLRGLCAKN